MGMGQPGVQFLEPVPVPAKTRTHHRGYGYSAGSVGSMGDPYPTMGYWEGRDFFALL